MRNLQFWLVYLILLVAQTVICAAFNFSQLVSFWFLPMMILCTPIRFNTNSLLVLAFVSGVLVDLLSQGVLGLTAAALLPVALCRNLVVRLVFGSEVFSRGEDISLRRQGLLKMSIAVALVTALFLILFIAADGAGTRPFWFNAVRFLLSLVVDTFFSLLLVGIINPGEGQKWR